MGGVLGVNAKTPMTNPEPIIEENDDSVNWYIMGSETRRNT